MATSNKNNAAKLEPILAADLAGLDPDAARLFVQRSAASAPGFAYELSKTLTADAPFTRAYDPSSFSRDSYNAFGNAIENGHFALARLWNIKRLADPQIGRPTDRYRARQGLAPWRELSKRALGSSASDGQILRSRRWMLTASTPRGLETDPQNIGAQGIASDAVEAFCAGRPALGLAIAKQLLAQPGIDIARATAGAHEWPVSVSAGLWNECKNDRKAYLNKIESTFKNLSSDALRAQSKPPQCSLLSHLTHWSQSCAKSDSSLSAELDGLESALWSAGAFASPAIHAQRFAKHPYAENDPRAILCRQSTAEASGDRRHERVWHEHQAVGYQFATIAIHCARNPDQAAGDAKAWDGFVGAHAGAPQANPDPFARWGASSCALLSLCGPGESPPGRLIEIGLQRGFSPAASRWALAEPGAMAEAFGQKHLPAAALQINPVDRMRAAIPARFGLHAPLEATAAPATEIDSKPAKADKASKASKPSIKDGDRPKDLPKAQGREAEARSWTYQSLASLCLACGRNDLARSLARAGCAQGTFVQVLEEVPSNRTHAVAEIAARFEVEALFDATGGMDADNPAHRKILRV